MMRLPLALVLSGTLAACTATASTPAPAGRTTSIRPLPNGALAPRTVEETCPDRLHALAGLFLEYALVHHDMPATLEDLRPLVDPLAADPFACPATGRPYVYVSTGLSAPGDVRKLIVYDASPAHNNKRGAIMMTPAKDRQPLGFFAIEIDDATLKAFK